MTRAASSSFIRFSYAGPGLSRLRGLPTVREDVSEARLQLEVDEALAQPRHVQCS